MAEGDPKLEQALFQAAQAGGGPPEQRGTDLGSMALMAANKIMAGGMPEPGDFETMAEALKVMGPQPQIMEAMNMVAALQGGPSVEDQMFKPGAMQPNMPQHPTNADAWNRQLDKTNADNRSPHLQFPKGNNVLWNKTTEHNKDVYGDQRTRQQPRKL